MRLRLITLSIALVCLSVAAAATAQPTGACCHPDGNCTIETEADCLAIAGYSIYQGDGGVGDYLFVSNPRSGSISVFDLSGDVPVDPDKPGQPAPTVITGFSIRGSSCAGMRKTERMASSTTTTATMATAAGFARLERVSLIAGACRCFAMPARRVCFAASRGRGASRAAPCS